MSTLDFMRRKRFINTLVSDVKLSYAEQDGPPHVRGNTIIMPPYKAGMTQEQDTAWMESLLTLCYSAMPENRADLLPISDKRVDMEGSMGFIYNMVCKHNHQQKRWGMLAGADEIVQKSLDQFYASVNVEECNPETQAMLALDVLSRGDWCLGTDYAITHNLSVEGKEKLDKLMSVYPEYNSIRESGEANYELSKKIYELLFDEQYDEEQQQNGDDESDDGDGENQEGEQEAQAGGKGEGEGSDGEEGEGEEEVEGKAPPSKDNRMGTPIPASTIGHNQENSPYKDNGGAIEALKVVEKAIKDEPEETARARKAKECVTSSLSTKVRNVLKVMAQARYQGGKKRGKINKRSIASISTGNDRIFRTKEVKDVVDTAVMLLVDCSGSMSGSKYTHAIAATGMLVDCMTKLHIPVEVQGFTYSWSGSSCHNALNYMFKPFNRTITADQLINNMGGNAVDLMGNADAESLLHAYDSLMKQKAKRKIMIVLSDGEPADGHNPDRFLRDVCKDIEKSRHCELYAIGIETRAVKDYYSNYVMIDDTKELEDKLLSLIKDAII